MHDAEQVVGGYRPEDGRGKKLAPTLVVGLGNPILGDDGVGWRVAEQVQARLDGGWNRETGASENENLHRHNVEVDCLAVGGLSLMERLVGYQKVILIDAILTEKHPLGAVLSLPLEALPNRALGHLCSAHDTTLQNALEMGRQMGVMLPEKIMVVGVEAREVFDFSEELSPEVAQAVPHAVEQVLNLIWENTNGLT